MVRREQWVEHSSFEILIVLFHHGYRVWRCHSEISGIILITYDEASIDNSVFVQLQIANWSHRELQLIPMSSLFVPMSNSFNFPVGTHIASIICRNVGIILYEQIRFVVFLLQSAVGKFHNISKSRHAQVYGTDVGRPVNGFLLPRNVQWLIGGRAIS